jgi:predicted glycoside hydrolase/deacetylase ChbG (UPF0249 family)
MICGRPLLIVNADDFGRSAAATNETLQAFRAGRITSATAMVYMEDSDRGAASALEAGLPTGLHINLTDPFTDPRAPTAVKSRHLRACGHFAGARFRARSWTLDPTIRGDVEAAVGDQLHRFFELFGRAPSHLDGHKHVHVCPNVALSDVLRPVSRRRNALWSWPGTRTAMGAMRAARRAFTYRAFLTTRDLISIHELFEPDAVGSERRLRAALGSSVEVMAHPGFPHEREALMSERWERLLAGIPTGSYADLRRPDEP